MESGIERDGNNESAERELTVVVLILQRVLRDTSFLYWPPPTVARRDHNILSSHLNDLVTYSISIIVQYHDKSLSIRSPR
jgi:hypothetical protein